MIVLDVEEDGRRLAEDTGFAGAYAYGATDEEALRNLRALNPGQRRIETMSFEEWIAPHLDLARRKNGWAEAWRELRADWRESLPARAVWDALLRGGWSAAEGAGAGRVIHWPGVPEHRHHRTLFPFADSDMLGPALLSKLALHLELRRDLIVRSED